MDLSHIAKLLDEEYFQNPCFFYYLIMNKKSLGILQKANPFPVVYVTDIPKPDTLKETYLEDIKTLFYDEVLKSININLPIMASLIITPALSYKNEGFTNCICLDPHLIFEDNKIPDRKIWIRRISRQTGKIIFG